MSDNREALLRERLTDQLQPTQLEITDQSHRHIGHPGANGGGHFQITISSPRFKGKTLLACHQMIYAALRDEIGKDIHALGIKIV